MNKKVARLSRELREARAELRVRNAQLTEAAEQQTATGNILRVINNSPTNAQPVFDTIIRSARQLCGARFGVLHRFDGERLHIAAQDVTPEVLEILRRAYPMTPSRSQASGRAILDRAVAEIHDVQDDPEYQHDMAAAGDWRSLLAVPMLRADGIPIGTIVLQRSQPEPFAPAHIEMLKTFAEQAVIAIENVRLFEELQQRSADLAEASEHKSRFLAAASHDLRQPMHALGLFVAQLRSHITSTDGSRLIDRIEDAVTGMNELFNALLDITKLDARALTPTISEFPIAELLARIGSTFAPVAQDKGLSFRLVPSSAWVRSDPILLERIVLNLVSNAVRYTASGGIIAGCRSRDGRLHVEVWDSGPGIPIEQRRKIFSEFYRLNDAAKTSQAGLGLGLAIVDRLCALLRHPIELTSTVGKGSRFAVTVPTAATRAAMPPTIGPPPQDAVEVIQGKLVMVIDNDVRVLEGMGGLLRNWGCRVIAAATPDAALAAAIETGAAARPDLLISDYHLGEGQSGITAIAKLRQAYGDIPAFLMTGDTAPERLREAQESGHHLLHKPVQPMRLRAMVTQFLTSSEMAPARRPAAAPSK